MLKYLVAILLILNLLLFGWMQGWFISAPQQQGRTPERVQTQIRPNAIQIVATSEQGVSSNVNPRPSEATSQERPTAISTTPLEPLTFFCLETEPLNGEQLTQLQEIVSRVLPASAWETDTYRVPVSWAVYLGPYANESNAFNRQQELRSNGIDANIIRGKPEFQPGITLGLYSIYSNAQNHLDKVHQHGITDAHIVTWQYAPKGQLLRIREISERQWDQLEQLIKSTDLPSFMACASSIATEPAIERRP